MTQTDIELKNIIKEFPARRREQAVRAVDDISLSIYQGEFFAMLGPSGCGKTTTLRMIAGFETPTSGDILLRGRPMQNVPPFHRPVNTVFQDYALFPHMTVLQNVMFGLRMEGVQRKEAERRAMEALELVRLPQAADRRPRQLSGGQQQRVALARALVKRPAVLLLDEPLGALDLKLRKAMQYELKTMQQQVGITFIYVTHDQEEALTMADRIAVMDGGQVLQIGRPEEIYEAPATRFVADFIGETNFVAAELLEVKTETGMVRLADGSIVEATLPPGERPQPGPVTFAIRPERIGLLPCEMDEAQKSDVSVTSTDEFKVFQQRDERLTVLEAVVVESSYIGTDTRYTVRIGDQFDLIVRIQNFGHGFNKIYKNGECVNVFWTLENARILSH